MPHTHTEERLLTVVRVFGTVQEAQLAKMLKIHPTGIRRLVNKLWKRDLLKIGGPDNAYVTHRRNADALDMLYVDCIWVLLAHTDKEEDLKSAYQGRDMIKLVYFSREKQSSYNFVYIADEEDYKLLPYINSRYLDMTEKDLINNMKFIFVSDSEEVLRGIPLEKFKFPSICMQIVYTQGRGTEPVIRQVVR